MISKIKTISVPYRDAIAGALNLTPSWERFFQTLMELISPLGFEFNFDLENGVVNPTPLKDIQFDSKKTTFVSIEYVIKRVRAAGPNSQALIETGLLHLAYNPGTELLNIRKVFSGPDNAGVTFSVDTNGQILYVTSSLTGISRLFRLTLRSTTMKSQITGEYKLL